MKKEILLKIVTLVICYSIISIYTIKENRQIHISIDDTIKIFEDLTLNQDKYKSILIMKL